jgi:hypothetical protein
MFKICSLKGNANQNHIDIPSHSSQNDCHQGNKQAPVLMGEREENKQIRGNAN